MYFAPVSVRPVRKPHCWFSHEAAHVYFAPGLKQLLYNYLFPLNWLNRLEWIIYKHYSAGPLQLYFDRCISTIDKLRVLNNCDHLNYMYNHSIKCHKNLR